MKRRLLVASWIAVLLAIVCGSPGAQAQTTYTWTGSAGTGSGWDDPDNWVGGFVPVMPEYHGSDLVTNNSADVVIFDSETAIDGYMPGPIRPRQSWTGGRRSPNVQLRNGSLTLQGTQNWGWNGDTLVIGDGDMGTLADVTVGWVSLNRDPNGTKTYVVNADGSFIVTGNITRFTDDGNQKRAVIRINGGAVEINGSIDSRFTNAANNYVDFVAEGSTFTAKFGGQLPDLATVQDNIGPALSFRSSEGLNLGARTIDEDNFEVYIPPPSGTMILLR